MSLIIENQTKPNQNNFLKWIVGSVVVAGLSVGLYFGVQSMFLANNSLVGDDNGGLTSVLDGTLFLTLAVFDSSVGLSTIATVFMDITSSVLAEMPIFELSETKIVATQVSMSAQAEHAVFLGMPVSENTTNPQAFFGTPLYTVVLAKDTNFQSLVQLFSTAEQLPAPDEADFFRQFPVISDYGSVLYSSLTEESYETTKDNPAVQVAESWNIYSIDEENGRQLLTQGFRPKWIREDNFAFLKNDGVYVYNLETKTEKLLWKVEGGVTAVHGFDVSNDVTYFAVTNPAALTADIVSVINWLEPETALLEVQLPIFATNPVFSPDNEHIAFIISHDEEIEGEIVPVLGLEYYSFEQQNFIPERDFINTEVIVGTQITDWQ